MSFPPLWGRWDCKETDDFSESGTESTPQICLSVSESTGLVSLPHYKHTIEQANNEAAYVEKTRLPAECHHMSLFMHLNNPFLQLVTRKTGKNDALKQPP